MLGFFTTNPEVFLKYLVVLEALFRRCFARTPLPSIGVLRLGSDPFCWNFCPRLSQVILDPKILPIRPASLSDTMSAPDNYSLIYWIFCRGFEQSEINLDQKVRVAHLPFTLNAAKAWDIWSTGRLVRDSGDTKLFCDVSRRKLVFLSELHSGKPSSVGVEHG